jgi:hypothetical protein
MEADRITLSGRRVYSLLTMPCKFHALAASCSLCAAFQTCRAASAFITAMSRPTMRSGYPERVRAWQIRLR